jgi:catechol 2,3-dioxygenase-like lactoylglutathione lyase family enzyme
MLTLDHLVILVDDLDHAVADYAALGFSITPGGTHADGLTHNALIVFADGTYLELIAFVDLYDTRDNVWGWRHFLPAGGLIDACFASDDLQADVEQMHRNGLPISEPSEGGRQRPDGTVLRWRSARFLQPHRVLPFLIEDITPREHRVPDEHTTHPNGTQGIRELTIKADDLDAAVEQWRKLPTMSMTLGTADADQRAMTFQLDAHTIRLVAPQDEDSPLHAGPPGPFAVSLVSSQPEQGWLDETRTHGVRIQMSPLE